MATNKNINIIEVRGQATGMEKLNQELNKTGINFQKLAVHAAVIIPTWAAMRAATLALPRAIGAATKEWLTFQTEMSRVATATRGSAASLGVLENRIKDFAATSKASLKDTASAVYALGSAGLSVSQQLVGLEHVMNVAIGTFGDVELTAKLMAGAINVFGRKMKDATTQAQQFKKIADVMAYTYSVQQVELDELATAMGYVASTGALIDISFEELTTTIGVLNTGMLKGSKAGTSLVNAFIQVANKSDKLSEIGIEIDTSKPLDFIELMDKLYAKFGDNKLSLDGLSKIMSTFGIRGGRAVALLLTNYEFFKKSLDDVTTKSKDFAEVMKILAEDNIPAIGIKIKNSFTTIWADVLDQWETPFKQFLKNIQGALDDFRAEEKAKKFFGETTTAEGFAKAAPGFAGGLGLTLAASSLPSLGTTEDKWRKLGTVESTATKLATDARAKYGVSGGVPPQKGQQGFQPLTPEAIAARQIGFTAGAYRTDAMKQVGVTPLAAVGSTLGTVARSALLAHAALKMVQASLNQFNPDDRTTEEFNSVMEKYNKMLSSVSLFLAKGVVKIGDVLTWLGNFLGAASVELPGIIFGLGGLIKDAILGLVKDMVLGFNFLFDAFEKISAVFELVQGKNIAENWGKIKSGLADFKKGIDNLLPGSTGGLTMGAGGKEGRKIGQTFIDSAAIASDELNKDKTSAERKKARNDAFNELAPFVELANVAYDKGEGEDSVVNAVLADIKARNANKDPIVKSIEDLTSKMFALDEAYMQAAPKDEPEAKKLQDEYTSQIMDLMYKLDKVLVEDTKGTRFEGDAQKYRKIFDTVNLAQLDTKEKQNAATAKRTAFFGLKYLSDAPTEQDSEDSLLRTFKADLHEVYKQAELEQIKLFDVSADKIALMELQIELDKLNEVYNTGLTISDFTVANEEKLIKFAAAHKELRSDILKIQQDTLKVIKEQQAEILKTGEFVRSAYKDIFTDMFEGDDFDTISDKFAESLGSGIKSNLAKTLGDALTDITGTDAVFGANLKAIFDTTNKLTNPIAQAHLDGIIAGAKIIEQAHIDGLSGKTTGTTYGDEGGIGGAIKKALFQPIFAERTLTPREALNIVNERPLDPIMSNTSYLAESILEATTNLEDFGDNFSIKRPALSFTAAKRIRTANPLIRSSSDSILAENILAASEGLDYGTINATSLNMSGGGLEKKPGIMSGLLNQFTGEKNASWGGLLRSTSSWTAGGMGLGAATGLGTRNGLGMLSLLGGGKQLGSLFNAGYGGLGSKTPTFTGFGAGMSNLAGFKGAGIGGAIGGTVGLMNTIDSFKKGNTVGGVGGILQTVGGYASMLPGWGGVAGMALQLVGSLISAFSGGDKKVDVQTRTDTFKVASKIDITNQRLDIINRNLLAIKDTMTYMLPESAYFSESVNISDQFSLHARRGLA